MTDPLPGLADIEAADARLRGVVVETPLLESPLLNAMTGGRILVKPECLQHTGSFKFRGASNKIRGLDTGRYPGGVVAYSSGNHAQGVAMAAWEAGIPALIVMPRDAPRIKIANTKRYGAELHLYDRQSGDRQRIAEELATSRKAALVPPYDDAAIIAGQGTVGLELARQLESRGIVADQLVAPCGGGGLIAGTALALKAAVPELAVYAAEPANFDDTARSLASGRRERIVPGAQSICDALLSERPGAITFALNRRLLSAGVVLGDDAALMAMATAARDFKLTLEPGGALALAALLQGAVPTRDRTSIAILSGGNADPETLVRALAFQ